MVAEKIGKLTEMELSFINSRERLVEETMVAINRRLPATRVESAA